MIVLKAITAVLGFGTLFMLAWGMFAPFPAGVPGCCADRDALRLVSCRSRLDRGQPVPRLGFRHSQPVRRVPRLFRGRRDPGLGYLWRIDTGLFALAATGVYSLSNEITCAVTPRVIDRGVSSGMFELVWASATTCWRRAQDSGAASSSCAASRAFRLRSGSGSRWSICRATTRTRPGYRCPSHYPGQGFRGEADSLLHVVGLPLVSLLALGLFGFTLLKVSERRLPADGPRDRFFVLLLTYSLLHLRTAMDRSDGYHVLHGSLLLVLLGLLDFLAYIRQRRRPLQVFLITAGCCLCVELLLSSCFLEVKGLRIAVDVPAKIDALRASLRPTKTWEEMLAPTSDQEASELMQGVEEVRRLLASQHVEGGEPPTMISAPLLYLLLDRESPTKYYLLGWACDRRTERELIDELEQNRVRAFLAVRGIAGTLTSYDVPDSHRIPLVHQYIAAKSAEGRTFETKLGELTILDSLRLPPAATPSLGPAPGHR